jgi:hypothetical protein
MNPALRPVGWCLAVAGLVVAGAGVGVLLWMHASGLGHVQASLAAARPWLLVWRFALIASVIAGWRPLVRGCARINGWDDAMTQRVFALRLHAALWLLCLELVVVDNVVGRCIGLIQAWASYGD